MDSSDREPRLPLQGDHEVTGRNLDRLAHTVATLERPDWWYAAYLDALRRHATISAAAKAAGVSRRTVEYALASDEAFRDAHLAALEDADDNMEASVYRRGVEGVKEPVYYKGQLIDYVLRPSDTAALAWLKAKRPDVWDRAKQVNVTQSSYVHEVRELRANLSLDDAKRLLATLQGGATQPGTTTEPVDTELGE